VAFELRDEKTTVLFSSEQYNALPECNHSSPVCGHFAKLRLPSLHKAFLVFSSHLEPLPLAKSVVGRICWSFWSDLTSDALISSEINSMVPKE